MIGAPDEFGSPVLLLSAEPLLTEALAVALTAQGVEVLRPVGSAGAGISPTAEWPSAEALAGFWKSSTPPTSLVVALSRTGFTPHLRAMIVGWAHRLVGVGAVILVGALPGTDPASLDGEAIDAAAVAAFTASLAKSLAPGHRVNAVIPGRLGGEERTLPCRRPGVPEDVGAAVAFLLGRTGDFVTGVSLRVDGGAHLLWPLSGA
ncbi:MAG: SDR family oxidoreductase [Thermoplasmata archaeon]|nr:SDR family oxidoreductase [Thermoplasmata archaeon]